MRQLLCAFRALLALLCVTGQTALVQAQVAPGAVAPAGGYPANSGYIAGAPAGAPNGVPPGAIAAQPPAQQVPQPPFTLNPAEEQQLEQLLVAWQHSSDQITTFSCDFRLWEYDRVFGPPPGPNGAQAARYCEGALRYAKPDKGYYRVTKVTKAKVAAGAAPGVPPVVTYEEATEPGEHWVCDGKAIYEVNATKKQLIERPLPPELQGKSIGDGPMPFVFGAEAKKLRQRYWMRINTPQNPAPDTIYLEAVPKQIGDAANFKHIDVMLNSHTLSLIAVRIIEPNDNHKTYEFNNHQKNAAMSGVQNFFGWFVCPSCPITYTRVVEKIPSEQAQGPGQNPPAGEQPPANAKRPLLPFLPR